MTNYTQADLRAALEEVQAAEKAIAHAQECLAAAHNRPAPKTLREQEGRDIGIILADDLCEKAEARMIAAHVQLDHVKVGLARQEQDQGRAQKLPES